MATKTKTEEIGEILRQKRKQTKLTLREISDKTGISASYLSRVEHGDRFPSASVLRRLAEPLGFRETDLMVLVGYLSPLSKENQQTKGLDPYVAMILKAEPVQVQRAVVDIVKIIKQISPSLKNRVV